MFHNGCTFDHHTGLKAKEKQAFKAMEHIYASLQQEASAATAAAEKAAAAAAVATGPQAARSTESGKEAQRGSVIGPVRISEGGLNLVCTRHRELFKDMKTCMGCGQQAPSMQSCGRCGCAFVLLQIHYLTCPFLAKPVCMS